MRSCNLVLNITLGAAITIGLVVALSFHAAPAEAQPAPAPAAPTIDHSDAISDALGYLKTQLMPNGGFNDDEYTTIQAVVPVVAAGRPISYMTSISGYTPLDYLATRAITYTHDSTGTLYPGRAGMLAMAVVAGDGDPYGFGGMNIIHELTGTYDAATGAYSTTGSAASVVNQWWAILGLAAAQETAPVSATDFLISLQEVDGGWGHGFGGDADATAYVLQALLASGHVDPTHAKVQEGLDFLRSKQLDSGGWPGWSGSLSGDSTASVIQALVAAGYTPATVSWATASGRTPHDDLLSLQQANGSFSGWDAVLASAHAVGGLAEAPLPVFGRVQRANRALTWMNELQNPDGSWPTGGFGHPAGPTCDAVLAYAAAGLDPDTVVASGSATSAMDYLSATASTFVYLDTASAGKLAVAVEAAGGDAYDFGGVNIVHVLTNTWYSPTLGAFGNANDSWHQAFAILGLAAAGESIPISATQTLTGLQNPDGSWTDAWGYDKPGSTGLVLQALIAAGVPATDTSVVSGTLSLQNEQNTQGGWDAFGSPSANSAAYAMQGLLAAGEDLVSAKWLKGGHSPYNALLDLQKSDGPFAFGTTDDFFSTRQAVPALLGVHYPLSHTFAPFASVNRGPDPDRMVAASPRASWGNSVDVVIPFGSDLDADGSVTLDWRVSGEPSWVTGTTVHRADGCYTATLPLTASVTYEFRATFTDADKVQYGDAITDTVILMSDILEPSPVPGSYYVYLPFISKQ